MNLIRLYFRQMGILLRGQMGYKSSFWMQAISQFVMTFSEFASFWILFTRFDTLAGWTREEICFFFGGMQVTFYLVECFGRGFAYFSPLVQEGTFDRLLLRPRPLLFQVMVNSVDLRRLSSIAVGIAAVIYGLSGSGVAFTWVKGLCLLLSVAGGFCLFLGLFMVEAVLCFHTVQAIEVVNVVTYGGRQACQYPATIYPLWMRRCLMYLIPYGLTMHLPLAYIVDKPLMGGLGAALLGPFAGFAFLAVMTLVWYKAGVRRYTSTGA